MFNSLIFNRQLQMFYTVKVTLFMCLRGDIKVIIVWVCYSGWTIFEKHSKKGQNPIYKVSEK